MENEGEEDGREREGRNEKAFTLCEKRSAEKIKASISRRSVRSMGKYWTKRGKIEVGAEKSDVPIEKSPEIGFKMGEWERK